MISIVELDGTPVATASCLSAAADIMRNVYPGWYHVLESPRFLRSSDRALRHWGSALRHIDGCVVMTPDPAAPPAPPLRSH